MYHRKDVYHTDKSFTLWLFIGITCLFLFKSVAQDTNIEPVRDAYLSIATDARAAGQGDLGVATSVDAFSQFWNPSKYVFSEVKSKIALTQILNNGSGLTNFEQLNVTFYNNLEHSSAYAISVRNYAYGIDSFVESGAFQTAHEVAIEGSYALRLSNEFAMSVSGRFISLKGKVPLIDGFGGESASNLYGIDVAGFFNGNEIAYSKFNGRWRAGFSISNLRGKSLFDNTDIEIYAPSMLKIGAGFDFIFDHEKKLGVTTEYKMLLDSYVENEEGERLDFGLEGSALALGFEFIYRKKISVRSGYSRGLNRVTDTFFTLGSGFHGRYADVDIAFLLGLSDEENQFREKLRISVSLDLAEVLSN